MGIRARIIGFHILGWLLFMGLIVGFSIHFEETTFLPARLATATIILFLVYASLFYSNAYLLIPKLYLKKRTVLYFTIIILLFIGVYFLKPYERLLSLHMDHHPFHRPDGFPPGDKPFQPRADMPHMDRGPRGGPGHLDIISIVLFLAVWSFSTAIQVIKQWRITERRALQAEADKVNAELSFLKAQINPHFLFNTLNNIYSLAITKSDRTPSAVMKLSNILRYITDDVHKDLVPLQSELDCVTNYIELQKLRLTDKVEVKCSVKGDTTNQEIAPLVFMTFIENAFKYGISSHEGCVITIEVTIHERAIDFFCQNRIMVRNSNEERTGVGINNVQKRLGYQYPDKHLLHINNEGGNFTVHLTIMT
jgi:hypothetical protein